MKKSINITDQTVIPKICCVCLAPSTNTVETRHSRFIPLGPAVHVTSSAMPIPLCAEHAKQVRTRMRLCKAAMIVSLIIGSAFGALLEGLNLWDAYPVLMLPFFLFIAFAIFFGFYERRQVPVRIRSPRFQKEKLMGTSRMSSATLVCDYPEFAEAIERTNKDENVQQER